MTILQRCIVHDNIHAIFATIMTKFAICIRSFEKTGRIMETPAAVGRAFSTGILLSKSKSYCSVLIKLGEYVGLDQVL